MILISKVDCVDFVRAWKSKQKTKGSHWIFIYTFYFALSTFMHLMKWAAFSEFFLLTATFQTVLLLSWGNSRVTFLNKKTMARLTLVQVLVCCVFLQFPSDLHSFGDNSAWGSLPLTLNRLCHSCLRVDLLSIDNISTRVSQRFSWISSRFDFEACNKIVTEGILIRLIFSVGICNVPHSIPVYLI